MKFRVLSNDFTKELQRAQTISIPVEKSTQNPILSHLKVSVTEGMLELFATNLEIGYKNKMKAEVLDEGSMTLETRKTAEIFKELAPGDDVEVDEGTKGWAVITVPGVVFRVATLQGEDFPAAPAFTDDKFMTVEAGTLRELIAKTDFAVSHDESMRTLSGALFHTVGDKLLMVATDGHRLAKALKGVEVEAQQAEAIIPHRALNEMKKLLEELEEEEKVQLKQEGDHLILKYGSVIFYCRLIKGNFPDYNQVVPSDFKRQVFVSRERLNRALRRVSILSNDRSKPVIMSLSAERMEIRSNSPEMGEAKEELDIQLSGDDVELGYNARYLMEALTAIEAEEVQIDIIDGASASVVKGKNSEEYLCVVMPMRV